MPLAYSLSSGIIYSWIIRKLTKTVTHFLSSFFAVPVFTQPCFLIENKGKAVYQATGIKIHQPFSGFIKNSIPKYPLVNQNNSLPTVRKSILIIEDSKALSCILSTTLKKDFSIFSANNYAEAFYYLRSKKLVDLIIMNVPSDESENYMFLAHLSSSFLFCNIPIVVLSESEDSLLKNKTKTLGATHFFSTPFDPTLLAEKVKDHIYIKESSRLMQKTV